MRFALALVLLLVVPPAYGGTPEMCRPYAAQSTEILMRWAWMRFYTGCMAIEGPDPVVPADAATAFAIIDRASTPVWPLERENVDALMNIGIVPASGPPTPPGRPEHDAAWAAKCARSHPRGWDAATGTITVRQGRKWVRAPCPD